MIYKVFARKWRPKKFSDIVGQDHIMQAIKQSFCLNRIHHAYILSGIRGIGKTTIGRLFAKGLNCEHGPTFNTCGQCKSCEAIESNCFIDLIEIDAASKTKVEDTREFLDNVQYFPSQGRYKIYLIDEVHMLSRYSFNALLKTLEEPPEHTKFILITTEHQKLPETILSRCLHFYLKPLNITEIVQQLTYICTKENIVTDVHSLELIAYTSQGSMRDALNLLEQAILLGNNSSITTTIVSSMFGILHVDRALELVENLVNGNIDEIMSKIDNYSILGIDWDCLFKDILTIFQKTARNQFLSQSIQKQINNNDIEYIEQRIYNLSSTITPENIQLYYQIFLLGRRELPYAPSHRIGMEMTILRALAFCPVNTNLEDINRYNKNNLSSDDSSEVPVTHKTNNFDKSNNIDNTTISNQLPSNLNHCEKNDSKNIKLSQYLHKHNIDNLYLNLEKSIYNSDNFKSSNIIKNQTDKAISNITSRILEARSRLMTYKENNKEIKIQSNSDTISEETAEKIFEKFSNINTNVLKNKIDNKKKVKI